MKTQAFNPYLPSWEYVPDGEPHVFDGRVYVYGSHDRFGAGFFCLNDYVCWSAPVDDLSDWRYEGVIYRRNQDSLNKGGRRSFFAPDVAKGTDGKYYLYYTLDFFGPMAMSVAVCDTPAGKYEFLGHVRFPDGHVWGSRSGEPYPFDPAVLVDDDGKVYLYSGFATKMPAVASAFKSLTNDGGVAFELEQDMLTIRSGPRLLFPRKDRPGAFENHAFFEASSIRKMDGKYCFVYSSEHNHEMCYAMGEGPFGPFVFGGTLVDLGDLYLPKEAVGCKTADGQGVEGVSGNGDEPCATSQAANTDESRAVNYLGNTHGGLLEINGQWYTFYHRQTNRHSYSRQACAEKLRRREDGGFYQAEVTSCGLNPGSLKGEGRYEARIACNLWSKRGTARVDAKFSKLRLAAHPYFTQSGADREGDGDQYIANMRDGAVAGFKYFDIKGLKEISVEVKGGADGVMRVSTTADFKEEAARIPLGGTSGRIAKAAANVPNGTRALYFQYLGKGSVDFISFTLHV